MEGRSRAKIAALSDALRHARYHWKPVRGVYLEKKNSLKNRPLGVPTGSDKLRQEVIRRSLEAYYAPQLSRYSHGLRPKRGGPTAVRESSQRGVGTKWVIEGDIPACCDRLTQTSLLSILRERIHDTRVRRRIENWLRAGYLADWSYNATLSGSPQGAVLSPLLSSLYLSKLEALVAQTPIPPSTRGHRRRSNPPGERRSSAAKTVRRAGLPHAARRRRPHRQAVPSLDPPEPTYRRLSYVR